MKRGLIIAVLFFVGVGLSAQEISYPDSLKALWQNENVDSVKAELMSQAFAYYFIDNMDTSFALSRRILEIRSGYQDSFGIAQIQLSIAALYNAQGNYSEALKYDRQAYEYFLSVKRDSAVAEALNGLGEDYLGLGLFNDAFSYYQQALSKAEELDDKLMAAVTTYNIGRVFIETGQLAKSAEYIRKSMTLSEAIDDDVGKAYSLNDLGKIFLLQGNADSALESLDTALSIAEQLGEDIIIPDILTNMARSYEEKAEIDIALNYYDKAANLFSKQSNSIELAKVNLKKGEIAMSNSDLSKAKELFDQVLLVAKQQDHSELLVEVWDALSKWYELSNEVEQSLKALRESVMLKDSLDAFNLDQQFSQTLMEFEIERKDLAIAELNAQRQFRQERLKNQEFIRNVLVVILAFTAILLFTFYRNSARSKKANEKLIVHQKEIEAKSKELESLLSMKDKFFSIVSHDLRSPINGLVGILDLLDEGHVTQDELIRLTNSLKLRLDSTRKMLDSLLDWALVEMNEIALKWDEIDLYESVDNNLAFFKEVNEKNVLFQNVVIPEVFVEADHNMLDLILRNLIANSIKFMEEGGEVVVSSVINDTNVTVSVRDNGVGDG